MSRPRGSKNKAPNPLNAKAKGAIAKGKTASSTLGESGRGDHTTPPPTSPITVRQSPRKQQLPVPLASAMAVHFFSVDEERTAASQKKTFKCKQCFHENKETYLISQIGYSNLEAHMNQKHNGWVASYWESFEQNKGKKLEDFGFVPVHNENFTLEAKNLFGHLEQVIQNCLPLAFVDNEINRKYSNLEKTTSKRLKALMDPLVKLVEDKIKAVPKDRPFSIKFDGSTFVKEHYIGVFFTQNSDPDPFTGNVTTVEFLLALAPLIDDEKYDAVEHMNFLQWVLDTYKLDKAYLTSLIGDNCSTNQSIADKFGIPLVGCKSHVLNLAMKAEMRACKEVLDKVQYIMNKFRTLKLSAALRKRTNLSAVIRNDTRWSSTFSMVRRYFRIKKYLAEVIGNGIKVKESDGKGGQRSVMLKLPSQQEEEKLHGLLNGCLSYCESLTKYLQNRSCTLVEVRALFDKCMNDYPTMAHYLAADAEIVHSPVFESALVKIQSGNEKNLSDDEKATVSCLLKPGVESGELDFSHIKDPAQRIIAEMKAKSSPSNISQYISVNFIHPTSVEVERLFSLVKRILTERRRAMHPITLEQLVFLKVNDKLWDVSTVQAALNQKEKDDRENREKKAAKDKQRKDGEDVSEADEDNDTDEDDNEDEEDSDDFF